MHRGYMDFSGGIGGHYYQSPDWDWRNAIFHDLIYKKWPVIYSEYDKALVYYIGYWLPSAALIWRGCHCEYVIVFMAVEVLSMIVFGGD